MPERPAEQRPLTGEFETGPDDRSCGERRSRTRKRRVDSIVVREEQELAGQIPLFGNPSVLELRLQAQAKMRRFLG
jgi:hypothetical protein